MSGGYFNYSQWSIADALFPSLSVDYGEDGHEQSKKARKLNPMRDRDVSEIVWDVLCLLHSFDWCESGDTGEDTYQADVEWFKRKWLRRAESDLVEKARVDLGILLEETQAEYSLIRDELMKGMEGLTDGSTV